MRNARRVNRRIGHLGVGRRTALPDLGRLLVTINELRDGEMQRITTSVLTRLEKAGLLRIVSNRTAIEQRIVTALRATSGPRGDRGGGGPFCDSHSRDLVGMDRHKYCNW